QGCHHPVVTQAFRVGNAWQGIENRPHAPLDLQRQLALQRLPKFRLGRAAHSLQLLERRLPTLEVITAEPSEQAPCPVASRALASVHSAFRDRMRLPVATSQT